MSIASTTVTSTAAELNILDGATVVVGEINALDLGSTAIGTAVASKAVVLDSNKDYTGLRNLTLSGELDAGSLDVSGNVDIDGTLETDALSIASTTVTSTAAELNILDGVTSTTAELNILDGVTSTAAELNILDAIARGKLVYGNSSGATALLAPGSDTTVLTSDGTDISWAAAGAASSVAADNITVGDAAVLLTTSSGNITIDAAANDSDIILKGTDGGADTTFLTIDGSAAGAAAFNSTVTMTGLVLGSTAVTSTAAELNILDGATVVVGEINALDLGSTAVGTAIASKAVILDSNKDYTGLRNVTLSGELDAGSLDVSGDADIDGTLETDALSIAGTTVTSTAAELNILDGVTSTAAELNILDGATVVVGEINALDLGSTAVGTAIASKAVVLDSNKDYTGLRNVTLSGELDAGSLDVSGDADIDGTLETDALSIAGTTVTSTAAELNILDGVTSTAAELNILDGVTSTAAELNILDGVTSTTAELNILDGVTSTAAELNILDGATVVVGEINALDLGSTAVGTAIASKAVILDSNKDYTGIRNLTISGELDAATLDISGAIDVAGNSVLASVDVTGLATAATFEPDGDTAAGDNAAIGYTAAEGLILTGQGSTNDVTIKNDADADVIEIPTGTVNVTVAGSLVGGTIILAATDTDTSNTGNVTIDFSAHQNFVLTLTGNTTLVNPSTEAVGQAGVFVFIQDGTGSRTLSLGTDYESPASGGITLSTAAAAVDVVPYFVKASGSIQLGAPQLAFG